MRLLHLAVCLLFAGVANAGGLIATVVHDADSVILRLPLIDEDGTQCPSTDIAGTESGLEVWVQADVESSATKLTAAGADLDAIATIGTYETPTAGEARWEVAEAGSCVYELHLENARFAVANANVLNITVMDTNGSAGFLDDSFWVDLTPVDQADLVDAIWDEPMSGHTTAGTAGEQLGTDVDAILVDTGTTLDGKVDTAVTQAERAAKKWESAVDGTPGAQTSIPVDVGPTVDDRFLGDKLCAVDAGAVPEEIHCSEITDYVAATDTFTIASGEIPFTIADGDPVFVPSSGGLSEADVESAVDAALGAGGADLTAVPYNSAWDADIESEANDAMVVLGLDHLVSVSVAGTDVADDSVMAQLAADDATADWDTYNNTTDSLEAIASGVLGDGSSLTNIPWNASWDTEVESEATDALNTYDPPTKAELDAGFSGQNDLSAAEVNAEVLDVIATDTFAQPGSVLSATATIKDALMWLATWQRNKQTQTSTTTTLRNDADSGNITTCAVSDNGTTFTRDECL